MKQLLLVIAIAIVAPAPAAAGTQPALKLVANAHGPFSPIGFSAGYYDLTSERLRIVGPGNTKGRSVAIPAGCTRRGVSLPDTLLVCDEGLSLSFRILNTKSGAETVVDTSPCGRRDRVNFTDLGRYWIGGELTTGTTSDGKPLTLPIFLNRTTGECRGFASASEGWRDIDRPDLPKRHIPTCGDRGTRRLLKLHRPSGVDVVFCHSKRRPVRLCRQECGEATLGRQTAAWLTTTRVHAVLLPSGRRFSWRLAPLGTGRPIDGAFIGFVGNRLYVSVLLRRIPPGEPSIRILSALLIR